MIVCCSDDLGTCRLPAYADKSPSEKDKTLKKPIERNRLTRDVAQLEVIRFAHEPFGVLAGHFVPLKVLFIGQRFYNN